MGDNESRKLAQVQGSDHKKDNHQDNE